MTFLTIFFTVCGADALVCAHRESRRAGLSTTNRKTKVTVTNTTKHGMLVMAYWLWHSSYGILVMAYQSWHNSYGILVMAYQSWHFSYGILVMATVTNTTNR